MSPFKGYRKGGGRRNGGKRRGVERVEGEKEIEGREERRKKQRSVPLDGSLLILGTRNDNAVEALGDLS